MSKNLFTLGLILSSSLLGLQAKAETKALQFNGTVKNWQKAMNSEGKPECSFEIQYNGVFAVGFMSLDIDTVQKRLKDPNCTLGPKMNSDGQLEDQKISGVISKTDDNDAVYEPQN